VIDSTTLQRLQALVRRESQSVLMYVDQAFPWTSLENEEALGRLQQIIRAERDAIAEVGRFLVKRRANLPYLGSFPASYTTINFVALDHILQRLINFEKGSIVEMESDLEAMASSLAQPVEV
jgi:hypothetical protein